ncbi:MAG: glycosyltransferase family 4 protein [Alphaproteobacteria bacterium]
MNTALDLSTAAAAAGNPPPATVLQVLPALVGGGVERGTLEIANGLIAAGWRAVVASAGGPMVPVLEHAGAVHVTLPLDRKDPFAIRRNVGRLRDVIAEHRVDLVHARSRAPAWSAYWAAGAAHVPFVTTYHSPYGDRWWKRGYNGVMARGVRVIAISEYLAGEVRHRHKLPPERLVTIPRGVDLASFNPGAVGGQRIAKLAQQWRLPDDAGVVMLPGRLTRWKGQEVLLRAAAQLNRADVVVVLVGGEHGDGGYRDELEALAEKLGIAARLRLVGDCRDMPAALMLADVVVSASTEPEGFGRVMAEALAMGRPVVASDHGGAREIVGAEAGWLVPPGDAASLAEALDAALGLDDDTRRQLAQVARARVERQFSLAAMQAATLDVYRDVLRRQ